MKYLVALVGALFLTILSTSVLPYASILGVKPDLLLIFIVCWAMVRGHEEAMVTAPVAGFLRDLLTSDPLGTSALALSPIVLLTALGGLKAIKMDFVLTLVVVGAGTLTYSILSFAVLSATGYDVPWLTASKQTIVPAIIINMLLTPIIYLPIRWFGEKALVETFKVGSTFSR